MPISMAPLATVLLIQQIRGSYAVAGIVTAVYALGATLGTPLLGRLVDRAGQPRVVGPAGLVSASFLVALALTAAGGAPVVVLATLAGGGRLAAAPVAAVMRGARRGAVLGGQGPRAADALVAAAVGVVFFRRPPPVGVLP